MAKKQPGVISVEIKADELGLSLESLSESLEGEFNNAIKDVAHMIHANIVAKAQSELGSRRLDYLKNLTLNKIGDNSYIIELSGGYSNKLEDGYPAYDMRDTLLASTKNVSAGPNAGTPWVKKSSSDGHKYAYVPFSHKPFSKDEKAQNLAEVIKSLTARNASGRSQKLTRIFKDIDGVALQGKVATVDKTGVANLDGLVKYQKTYKNKKGNDTTQSLYMTYRTISEVGQGWMHPGYEGLKAFPEAEQAAEHAIEQILKSFLK